MKLIVSLVSILTALSSFAEPVVTSATAKQRFPWNGLVDIYCTVSGFDGASGMRDFTVAAGEPGIIRPVSHLWVMQGEEKSADLTVREDGNYHFVWDARADRGEVRIANMVIRVALARKKVQLWEGGPYWAEMNVGAEEPWEYGYYFRWGATVGFRRDGDAWVASDEPLPGGIGIDKLRWDGWLIEVLRGTYQRFLFAPEHDAAQVQWGGGWHLPTIQEFDDLVSNCDWTWTMLNGVNGCVVRGRGDYASASIFLPAAGHIPSTSVSGASSTGYYWSSAPSSRDGAYAWNLCFNSKDYYTKDTLAGRHVGKSVRPVQEQEFVSYAFDSYAVETSPFILDTTASPIVDAIILPWDAKWISGNANAIVVITDNGTEVKRTTGTGEFSLDTVCGTHQLEYSTYIDGIKQSEVYSVGVRVAPSFAGHSGAITKPAVEPTSATDGKTAEITCSRCCEVLQAQTMIPALGYIRNVTARQLWPHKKVEVCYEVAEDIGDVVDDCENALASITATYGSTTKTAAAVCGDRSATPGHHAVVWDFEADGIAIDEDVIFSVTYASVCGVTSGTSGEASIIGGNGLVAYYPFDGTFEDASGNGHDFTEVSGGVFCEDRFGYRNGAVSFNGNGHLQGAGILLKTPFTVACWYQTDEQVFGRKDLAEKMYNGRNALLCPLHGGDNAGVNLCVGRHPTYAREIVRVNERGSYWDKVQGDGYSWGVSRWNHVCMVVENDTSFCIYHNGSLVATGALSGKANIFGLTFGGDPYGYYMGKADDLRVYNWALSGSEVQSVRNGGAVPAKPAIPVNTSSAVKDGMDVSGTVHLGYSPFADGEAKIYVDNKLIFSSRDSGTFAWQPLTTGSHTLKHVSGGYIWTRTVNVTEFATAGTPSPQPPTAADANISIGTTTKAFGVEGGSSSITTAGSGTWNATASESWITIPAAMASRNAGLPVAYQVAATTEVEPRTGYIYVSGHVFTITQAGIGATLDSSSSDFETEGGTGSFTVLADAQSSWMVRSNEDWISVTTDAGGAVATSGTGEGAVYFTVAPWNEVSTRSGTITAAGCTFTVNQSGRRMKISGPNIVSAVSGLSASFDYQSHVLAVTVDALSSTDWDVELDGSWLSVVDGGSGHGGGNVAIAVNENPSWLARSGSVRIGTETLIVNQEGRPSSALSFSISPAAATASVKGANAIIAVTATPDLPWTATSQANWLTIMPELQTGAGNGNVVYSASPNPTMAARTGAIQVSATASAALPAKTHTVTQPAATAMISTGSHTFAAAGESFSVAVATDDIVGWSVAENCDWLSVAGSTSHVGAGSVSLAAAENPTVDPRGATVTIAGHAFVATQRGRTVEVEYETKVFGPEGGYDSLDVHPDGNAVWTALPSDPSWITIWGDDGCEYDDYGNVIGMGDATLEYIVSDYVGDGTPRTATITIGDKSVYITQRPYDLSINPSAVTVSGNAGAGEVGVPATIGQIWNAIATEPWITIIDGSDSGTGGGTVRYTYTDNDTGEERTGKIIISGEAYTITQARRMVSVLARVEGGGGRVSGAGSYYLGSSVTLTAVASDGYEFTGWTLPAGSVATSATLSVVADANKEIVATFRRIPTCDVNGETVRKGASMTFTAPNPILDAAGTTKIVCTGTSAYPNLGTSFKLVVTGDIAFEWDLWTTNYLVTVEQAQGGQIRDGADAVATSVWLPAGSILNLTAVPNTGNSLFRWVVNGETLPTCSTRSTRLKITAPLTVSAVFGVFDETLATALDAPTLTFKTGGDANWAQVIDASAQTGYTSARSGAIGPESETWLDTTVVGAGTLTFRWRVDCEKDDGGGATWDRLSVWVNGVEAARLDGTTEWQTVALPISAPKTTIRWSFYRDDHDEPGATHENAAWVDGVTFIGKEGE